MTREELAKAVKEAAYLEGDFILSSGQRSKYYLDKWRFETDPALLREIAQALATLLPDPAPERLAGVELGGVPLVTALALETGLPYLIVRRQAKEYGTAKEVEGLFDEGDRVALIEDVLTTAGQARQAAERLGRLGLKVEQILCVLDRGGIANLRAAGYEAEALFGKSDLGIP